MDKSAIFNKIRGLMATRKRNVEYGKKLFDKVFGELNLNIAKQRRLREGISAHVKLNPALSGKSLAKNRMEVKQVFEEVADAIKGKGGQRIDIPTALKNVLVTEGRHQTPAFGAEHLIRSGSLLLAGAGFGAGSSIVSNITMQARLKKMFKNNPEFYGDSGRYPESKAVILFKTLYKTNPDITEDPNMAATAVKQFIDAQGIPTETFIGLKKIKSTERTRDKIFSGIMGAIQGGNVNQK